MSLSVFSTDSKSDDLFVTLESFLKPVCLYQINATPLETRHLFSEMEEFKAEDMQV